MIDNSIYRFNIKKLNDEEISLSEYKDKVLLIVNTASQCSFTPQLKELVELKNLFEGKDFDILAFPSNDFGGQEPLEDREIERLCETEGINYPVFEKIRVRGPYAHPLFKFFADKKENGKLHSIPRWNFHKFLINKSGLVTDFFYPFTKPLSSKIRKRITRLLAAEK
jgi:glutathione peroxidase